MNDLDSLFLSVGPKRRETGFKRAGACTKEAAPQTLLRRSPSNELQPRDGYHKATLRPLPKSIEAEPKPKALKTLHIVESVMEPFPFSSLHI